MRASTANRVDATANKRARLSSLNPLIFELTDQVVMTFQASNTANAPNTLAKVAPKAASKAARDNACPAGQPIGFNGWRLTVRGGPSTDDSFTIEAVLSDPVLVDPVRVDPDEEVARRFRRQQSYQAAAQFLQIAQSTLDKLLQAVQADNEDPS